jgi:hypothetical protein
VVAIIEGKEEAGGAQYIEFKVSRSETEPDNCQASWRFPAEGTVIGQSTSGNAVLTEFRFAVDCADQHGVPFVWINDPDQLFPPWVRR